MINENWSRWIWASVIKHFNDRRKNLPMYVEGADRDTQQERDYIELRLDGPYFTPLQGGQYKLELEINVLVGSLKDERDAYKIHKNVGVVQAAFENSINIFKFGDQDIDDKSLFTCIALKHRDRDNKIVTSHFGIVEPTNRIMFATVEGHYTALL